MWDRQGVLQYSLRYRITRPCKTVNNHSQQQFEGYVCVYKADPKPYGCFAPRSVYPPCIMSIQMPTVTRF